MDKKTKKTVIWSICGVSLAAFGLAILFTVCYFIVASYNEYIPAPEALPECHAALVLGCSPTVMNGRFYNSYFTARIKKAAELYHSGKVKKLLLSGDNGRKEYNEPQEMRKALVALRVPDEDIYCDYAGFRTIDSVIRADAVFGQRKFIVVSQSFHCERAIYLARHLGIECYGYAADVRLARRHVLRRCIRETFARVCAVFDIICCRQPKFYGPRVDMTSPQKKDPESV